ncbi:MAG: glycosyltransferase [Candidatus Wildermuthbacteria bacterium]|nr:glycosyltransferase [Candidatus Wildermuthbacteria bacterium]
MKVALVHDYLNQFGGAERVLLALARMFPQAPIYTLFYEPGIFGDLLKGREIKTSFLNHPFIRKRHRMFIPLFAKAAENIDLGDKYDLIISDSAGWAKGIRYTGGKHIAYVHTPLRYAWEPGEWLGTLFPKPLIKLASPIINYLRRWDKIASQRPDLILANSAYTARKIKNFYGRGAAVLHPPVWNEMFYPDLNPGKENYFVAFGRLIHYKRFDLVVKAFNKLDLPIKIIGSGPEEEKLKKLVRSEKIEMIPEIKDENLLRRIISDSQALIFPQVEDFGLSAAESLACGTAVIAYRAGGALEIVQDGINGAFFDEQTEESLTHAVQRFQKMDLWQRTITQSAQKFSEENFKTQFSAAISLL